MKNGPGVFTNSIYALTGEWAGNKQRGMCSYEYFDGRLYEGECGTRRNDQVPRGVMRYPNGDAFSGLWLGDFRHRGLMTFASGEKYDGLFEVIEVEGKFLA